MLEKGTIWCPVSSLTGQQDTSVKKTGHLVTLLQCTDQERVELYLQWRIHHHGVVLNKYQGQFYLHHFAISHLFIIQNRFALPYIKHDYCLEI
jgi:hypothetical protein